MSLLSATLWTTGESIELIFSDLVATWNGTNPTVALGGSGLATVTGVWFWNGATNSGSGVSAQSPAVLLMLSAPVTPGTLVTVSYGAGVFALGSAVAGAVAEAATTSFAVTSSIGVNPIAVADAARTTTLGWNWPAPSPLPATSLFANHAKGGSGWSNANVDSNADFVSASGGTPAYTCWQLDNPITSKVTYEGTAGNLIPYVMYDEEMGSPGALMTVYWDGATGDLTAVAGHGSTITPTGTSSTGNATNNHRSFYNQAPATASTTNCSNFVLNATGSGPITNLRVYGPGSALGDHFHTRSLAQIKYGIGANPSVMRYMEAMQTNSDPKYLDAHLVLPTQVNFNVTPPDTTHTPAQAAITSIQEAVCGVNGDSFFSVDGSVFLFDITAPGHGLPDPSSTVPSLWFLDVGGGSCNVTATGITYKAKDLTTQSQADTSFGFTGGYLGRKLDANTIRVQHAWIGKPGSGTTGGGGLAVLGWTLAPTDVTASVATISVNFRSGVPPEETVAYTAQFPGCAHWDNVPCLESDTAYAARLNRLIYGNSAGTGPVVFPPGTDYILEYNNEWWNSAFFHNNYCQGMGQTNSTTSALSSAFNKDAAYYVYRGHQLRTLARAAFTAAGLNPNNVVWTLNSQASNNGAEQMFKCAQALGIDADIDAIAWAPYYSPLIDGSYITAYTSLTVNQVHDLMSSALRYQNKVGDTSTNLTYFGAKTFNGILYNGTGGHQNIRQFNYEWGCDSMRPSSGTNQLADALSRKCQAHPRMADLTLYRLKQIQTQGSEKAAYFKFSGNPTVKYGSFDAAWHAVHGLSQTYGVGDGSDGKTNNTLDLENPRGQVSTIAYGLKRWKSFEAGGSSGSAANRGLFLKWGTHALGLVWAQ